DRTVSRGLAHELQIICRLVRSNRKSGVAQRSKRAAGDDYDERLSELGDEVAQAIRQFALGKHDRPGDMRRGSAHGRLLAPPDATKEPVWKRVRVLRGEIERLELLFEVPGLEPPPDLGPLYFSNRRL